MSLERAVVNTISYFDLFEYPLSRAEIWKYLMETPASLGEVETALDSLAGAGKIEEKNGLVFLPGRFSIVATRASRYRHAARKWRRARQFAGIFAALPGVRLVGIGNTLAYNNSKDGSDIDFFIVVRPGTIWRTRIICAALAALLGLRPTASETRDKLCLSFFVSERALDLGRFAAAVPEDIYLASWASQMIPLVGDKSVYENFLAQNKWVEKIFPNASGERGVIKPSGVLKYFFTPLALLPGAFIKKIQVRHFPAAIRAGLARADGSVAVSDDVLKFHVGDRRAEIYGKWKDRISNVDDFGV